MKKQVAVEQLNSLFNDIDREQFRERNPPIKTKMNAIMVKAFGLNSQQHIHSDKINYEILGLASWTNEEWQKAKEERRIPIRQFVSHCIEFVNANGVIKEHKTGYLKQFDDWKLVSACCILISTAFGAGYKVGFKYGKDEEYRNQSSQVKQASLSPTRYQYHNYPVAHQSADSMFLHSYLSMK